MDEINDTCEILWVMSPVRGVGFMTEEGERQMDEKNRGHGVCEPFKHTFQARYHREEGVIFIAETYESQRAGIFLADQAERLLSIGAWPDPDFTYAWALPYSAENWENAMLFIRETDGLLDPYRVQSGMCWHCGVVVRGLTCPHCQRHVQAWYETNLEIESGPMANTRSFSS